MKEGRKGWKMRENCGTEGKSIKDARTGRDKMFTCSDEYVFEYIITGGMVGYSFYTADMRLLICSEWFIGWLLGVL